MILKSGGISDSLSPRVKKRGGDRPPRPPSSFAHGAEGFQGGSQSEPYYAVMPLVRHVE